MSDWLVALAMLAELPHGPPDIVDQVDRIELNHLVCPETATVRLTQVIYWGWRYDLAGSHVVAWRLVRDERPFRIRHDPAGPYERYVEPDGTYRIIRARVAHESWTVHDPELTDRELLPQDQRRGLSRPRRTN